MTANPESQNDRFSIKSLTPNPLNPNPSAADSSARSLITPSTMRSEIVDVGVRVSAEAKLAVSGTYPGYLKAIWPDFWGGRF